MGKLLKIQTGRSRPKGAPRLSSSVAIILYIYFGVKSKIERFYASAGSDPRKTQHIASDYEFIKKNLLNIRLFSLIFYRIFT
jgi:hypothetical protein